MKIATFTEEFGPEFDPNSVFVLINFGFSGENIYSLENNIGIIVWTLKNENIWSQIKAKLKTKSGFFI